VEYQWNFKGSAAVVERAHQEKWWLRRVRAMSGNLFEIPGVIPFGWWGGGKPSKAIHAECDQVHRQINQFGRAVFVAENIDSPWLGDWRLAPGSPGVKGEKATVGLTNKPARANAISE